MELTLALEWRALLALHHDAREELHRRHAAELRELLAELRLT